MAHVRIPCISFGGGIHDEDEAGDFDGADEGGDEILKFPRGGGEGVSWKFLKLWLLGEKGEGREVVREVDASR